MCPTFSSPPRLHQLHSWSRVYWSRSGYGLPTMDSGLPVLLPFLQDPCTSCMSPACPAAAGSITPCCHASSPQLLPGSQEVPCHGSAVSKRLLGARQQVKKPQLPSGSPHPTPPCAQIWGPHTPHIPSWGACNDRELPLTPGLMHCPC